MICKPELIYYYSVSSDGKKCPVCKLRIYHDKWNIPPQLAEDRWAHKEAKQRELDDVIDAFSWHHNWMTSLIYFHDIIHLQCVFFALILFLEVMQVQPFFLSTSRFTIKAGSCLFYKMERSGLYALFMLTSLCVNAQIYWKKYFYSYKNAVKFNCRTHC